jgi:hypothetical protein
VRLEKWLDGAPVGSEQYTVHGNMHFKNDVILMLQFARSGRMSVYGAFSVEPATAVHDELVFFAAK